MCILFAQNYHGTRKHYVLLDNNQDKTPFHGIADKARAEREKDKQSKKRERLAHGI